MRYIFILRHGPAIKKHHNKILNKKLFNTIAPYIAQTILKFGDVGIIYSSPIPRCMDTAKILNKFFRTTLHKEKKLLRCDSKIGCSRRLRNSSKFGKKILKKTKNVLIITHSSVLRGVINGACGHDINKFKVKRASLSIYDKQYNKFILFNQGWMN